MPQQLVDNKTKDDLYDTPERTFSNLPRNCIQIMVGYLNAQVGCEEVFQCTVGKVSLHLESNNNKIRLISFDASDLIISNIQF